MDEAARPAPDRSGRVPGTILMLVAAAWQVWILAMTALSLPEMTQLYSDLGAILPLPTRLFLVARWLLFLCPVPTVALAVWVATRKEPSPRLVMLALVGVVSGTLALDAFCRIAIFAPMWSVIDKIK